jgi:hypothetical protein
MRGNTILVIADDTRSFWVNAELLLAQFLHCL